MDTPSLMNIILLIPLAKKKADLRAALLVAAAVSLAACGTARTPSDAIDAPQVAVAAPTVGGIPNSALSPLSSATQHVTTTGSPAANGTTSDEPIASAVETAAATIQTVVTTPTTVDAAPSEETQEATITPLVARLSDQAWDELVILTEEYSPRASATEQEKAAADYLVEEFRSMGYEVKLQPFTVELLSPAAPVLTVSSPTPHQITGFPMTNSGRGSASGALVDVGKAYKSDIENGALEGKIALIERGEITFEEKVTRVANAGAAAAVVYNNVPGGFSGRLTSLASVPAVTISRQDGVAIKALANAGEVGAEVSVVYEVHDTWNVVAEKPSAAGAEEVVVLGGHYDTVPDVPGANDNGSGIATLLTIASEISSRSYPFTVRFVPFGSEEVGLLGSKHYVESLTKDEQQNILAMLNFDAMATGPITGVLGSFDLTNKIVDYGRDNGIDVKRRLTLGLDGGSSDHVSFAAVDIPVVFFLADDFSRIHTIDDKLQFVQRELMGNSAALAIGLLSMLAER